MANNIAPELLKKVQDRYAELLKKNTVIKSLDAKIEKGKATYRDADMYAAEVGDMLAEAYKVITGAELPEGRLLYDIADAVLRPTLTENYEIVSDMATKVQKALNEEAGINLNAVKPSLDDNRVQGIIDKVADAENFDDIAWMLQAPVRNFAQNVVDEAVRANADFHAKVGLSPKIVRIAEPAHMASYFKRGKNGKRYGPYFQMEPCQWCLDLVGTYDYFDVKDTGNDVFRRHENCKCIVDYIPGNGKRQNVWDKGWQDINQGEVQERISLIESKEKQLTDNTPKDLEYESILNNLKKSNISYLEPERWGKQPTTEEIVNMLSGGDKTGGSCASLAFAYAGNKGGSKVLDFRGGESMSAFRDWKNIRHIAAMDGVESITVKNKNGFKSAIDLLKKLDDETEYIFMTGQHAAIVFKPKGKAWRFLELQDGKASGNGYTPLNREELKFRFGVRESRTASGFKLEQQSMAIKVDTLAASDDYMNLMGYINTAENTQLKGADGGIK